MSDKSTYDIDDLRWIRVFSPSCIPKNLVENIRDRDFSVEDFYKYQEINCIIDVDEEKKLNPLSHLYVLADKESKVRGFLWFTVDALSKDICMHTYSIEKGYWQPGKAVNKVSKLLKEIKNKAKLNKIYWITNYPKHSKRYGFKESSSVLMEYSEDEPNNIQEEIGA